MKHTAALFLVLISSISILMGQTEMIFDPVNEKTTFMTNNGARLFLDEQPTTNSPYVPHNLRMIFEDEEGHDYMEISEENGVVYESVSYTHLTLPTNREV